jgi:ribosomal protein S18 acetylase RimI-like enzyme
VSAVVIRRAATAYARAIAAVHVASWQVAYRGLVPDAVLDGLSVERRERGWRERLGRPDAGASFTLVAERDGAVAGFCSVAAPSRDGDAGERTAEVAALYVEPAQWRTGVGATLLRAALDALRADGFDAVTLWVLEDNARGRAFYRRLGFAADGATQELAELEAREVRLRAAL